MRKAGVEGVPGWFADQAFPMPFDLLPTGVNWAMVTWTGILAAVALMLGLFTRFSAFSLFVVTVVAVVSTHWPESWTSPGQLREGHSVSRVVEDGEFRGNFRIGLLFLAMLLPLVFMGGGRSSLDHLLVGFGQRADRVQERNEDLFALALLYRIPTWGIVLLLGSAAAAIGRQLRG